jgi:hypothetical protein
MFAGRARELAFSETSSEPRPTFLDGWRLNTGVHLAVIQVRFSMFADERGVAEFEL